MNMTCNIPPWLARVMICALLGQLISPAASAENETPTHTPASSEWTPLFNGRSLEGWHICVEREDANTDPGRIIQVEDGVIHIYKDQEAGTPVQRAYFSTDASYSHYRLRFQYKWGTKKFAPRMMRVRDAGLMYHVTGPDIVWPRCLECQVQEGDTGDCFAVRGARIKAFADPQPVSKGAFQYRPSEEGGVETTLTALRKGSARLIKNGTFEIDGWNTVEVIVRGNKEVTHIVNGRPNFHGTQLERLGDDNSTWEPMSAGRIAFQAEYAEVFYRNIEIQPIPDGPLHPASDVAPAAATHSAAPLPTVPEGFEISLVAAPPLVEYPTLACFDDLGRLYVSEGANINDKYEVLAKTLPRSIRRLDDTNGDGVFDRFTVFAAKMTFPYGGVWHDGALYVASDPTLWRLEDTDGDGVADKRDVLITGFQAAGHASCIKGGFYGRDGFMYFCGGNEGNGFDLKDRNGTQLKDHAAACIFRVRPDGTGLEYFANGAAGVYDLCFDPSGDLFGVVTILKNPRGDGLMHWVYGGAYQTSRPRSSHARMTGDPLPPLLEWPQTSPSGAVQYQSGALGKEYIGDIFTAHFGTHVVTRNKLLREGATWRTEREENFVQSSDLNCRFTDVLEDADGSLVVVNTGGWFRLGCPTAQVGEGDLRGAIYRVRKKGKQAPPDPRGLQIAWSALNDLQRVQLLADPRFEVRERATEELARRGAASVPALRKASRSTSAEARRNAIWALTRIDDAQARAAVRESLSDRDLPNLLAALHSIGNWRDGAAFEPLVALLKSDEPAVRREAATALGRIGNTACVPALFEMLGSTSDRFLEQAAIFAVIEINAPEATLEALHSDNPSVQRGALIALDQVASDALTEDDVSPLLQSNDLRLQKAALAVCARHAEWARGLLSYLGASLEDGAASGEQLELVLQAIRGAIRSPDVQALVGRALASEQTPANTRSMLLDVVRGSRLRKLPAVWRSPLVECLKSADEYVARQAADTMARFADGKFVEPLKRQVLDASRPTPVRIAAAVAEITIEARPPDDRLIDFVFEQCMAPDTEVVSRLSIAQALGAASLSPSQLARLTSLVASAGPLELPELLKAYEDAPTPVAGKELMIALATSPGIGSISASRIRRLVDRYPSLPTELAAPVLKRFSAASESQAERMKELEFALTGGDAKRGHDLFMGKAACSQCHRVNQEGARIGPDLSRIGDIRTRRDLIEAIAFPSATIARGFEPVTIIVSGRAYAGFIRGESAKEVTIMTPGRSETTLSRDEIEDIIPSSVSIMPQGLDRNLSSEELRDLVAYLASLQ